MCDPREEFGGFVLESLYEPTELIQIHSCFLKGLKGSLHQYKVIYIKIEVKQTVTSEL